MTAAIAAVGAPEYLEYHIGCKREYAAKPKDVEFVQFD